MKKNLSRREAIKRGLIAAPGLMLAGQIGFTRALPPKTPFFGRS